MRRRRRRRRHRILDRRERHGHVRHRRPHPATRRRRSRAPPKTARWCGCSRARPSSGSVLATGGIYSIITLDARYWAAHGHGNGRDAAGNVSAPSTGITITVDTSAPAAPSTPDSPRRATPELSNTDDVTSNATPTFTGTAESGVSVTLFDGATPVVPAFQHRLTTSSARRSPRGRTRSPRRRATPPGTPRSRAAGLPVTIDTVAPGMPLVPDLDPASDLGTSNTDNVTADNNPTFFGTAETASPSGCSRAPPPVGTGTATGGNYSISTATLTNANHTITAAATDLTGNATTRLVASPGHDRHDPARRARRARPGGRERLGLVDRQPHQRHHAHVHGLGTDRRV